MGAHIRQRVRPPPRPASFVCLLLIVPVHRSAADLGIYCYILEMCEESVQEMLERGILTNGSHNISFAHSREDISTLLATYDEVLASIAVDAREGTVHEKLRGEVLAPLFRVRDN